MNTTDLNFNIPVKEYVEISLTYLTHSPLNHP